MMKKQTFWGIFALILTAFIWGLAFSAQRSGLRDLTPLMFNALRNFLGSAALIPVICGLDLAARRPVSFWGAAQTPQAKKTLLTGGLCCGAVMTVASILQQWGLKYATAGKAGFLTALYIVLVPVIGIFLGKKTTVTLWGAVVLALAGSYCLCSPGTGGFALNTGDILLIACAAAFSMHILVIDYFAPKTDCVRMSALQFLVAGILSLIPALCRGESCSFAAVHGALIPLLYCGIFSSGCAYTLQIVGQKYVHPVAASLIMSLESVFSAVGGWMLLGETLKTRELCGCVIIFCAVILAQIPMPHRKKVREEEPKG